MPAAAGPEPHDQGVPLDWTNVYLSVAYGLPVASLAECNGHNAAVTASQLGLSGDRIPRSAAFRCSRSTRHSRMGSVFSAAGMRKVTCE